MNIKNLFLLPNCFKRNDFIVSMFCVVLRNREHVYKYEINNVVKWVSEQQFLMILFLTNMEVEIIKKIIVANNQFIVPGE